MITCGSEVLSEQIPQGTLRPGIYTCIVIHRDGSALDDIARASIFELFLKRAAEQTAGLALARAYAIVRKGGGDIALTSEPGQGSIFTIYLRRYLPESRFSEVSGEELRSDESYSRLGPAAELQTILIVEDEPLIHALVLTILGNN